MYESARMPTPLNIPKTIVRFFMNVLLPTHAVYVLSAHSDVFERRGAGLDSKPLVEIRMEFDSVSGLATDADRTVVHRGQTCNEVLIPSPIIGSHTCVDECVWRIEGKMGRGGEHDRSCAVMRSDWQSPGLGHRRDLARLGEAAAP